MPDSLLGTRKVLALKEPVRRVVETSCPIPQKKKEREKKTELGG